MEHDEIFEKVKGITVDKLGVDAGKIASETTFVGDLGADSLDLVELIMALEEEFSTEISDEDAEKISTVNDAVSYIENKMA